jgi:hypothetical protein
MYWIIEQSLHTEPFYEKLLPFLDRFGIPYELVKHVPFSHEIIPQPTPTQNNVVTLGSYGLALSAKNNGWTPGAWENQNFDFCIWSKGWEGFCLNQEAVVCTFGTVPKAESFFIRPATDTKEFTGQVFSWEEFAEWQHKVIALRETYTTLDGNTNVIVGPVKNIKAEYRFIVVDGSVITGSLYKRGETALYQECNRDDPAFNFAQQMTDLWVPDRVFALDVAISEDKYWVLEMGCFNAAGLYHCDIQKIVMAIEEMEF